MFAAKFNYCVERATIVAVCLWGNWALYYWVAVLGFDASYNSLKAYTPILLLQIAVSLFYLLRTDLGFSNASRRTCEIAKRSPRSISGRSFVILSAIAVLLAVGVVLIADHFRWTRSTLSYNLFWSLLLPASLAYFFYPKALIHDLPTQAIEDDNRTGTLDCLLFCLCVAALVIAAYASGIPSWDDAFYGHVMSSMLANPALPVQGQDLLLGTSAPYSLHPSYRGVGYEALIALISDAAGWSPLRLYFDVFPVPGVVLWSFAAYLFMRVMRAPYPGLAVTVSLIIFLNWGQVFPMRALQTLWWGKSLVALIAAPLLFFSVAVFLQTQTIRTWLFLLFSVCSLAIWSSTALFVVPISVGLACIVFSPSIRNSLPVLFATFLSLTPILLLFLYSLLVLQEVSANTEGVVETGILKANGTEYGGLHFKSVLLVALIVLPLVARTVNDTRFQTNILRVCVVGIFTVMAPFLIEAIARLTGLSLLAIRLPSAYPGTVLFGVIASIAVTHLNARAARDQAKRVGYQVMVLALVVFCAAYGVKQTLFNTERIFAKIVLEELYSETVATRKLIPDDAYVAAGDSYYLLPAFPDPPSFVSVRHYLNYHKYFLPEDEYMERKYLQAVLEKRLPEKSETMETTMDSIVSIAGRLGVTTLVYPSESDTNVPKPNAGKARFVAALTARLTKAGYACSATPSGSTIVCNLVGRDA